MTAQTPLVNVLYGTVTGNAEQIARRIHAELPSQRLRQGAIACLADHKTVPAFTSPDARADTYNVIVVSTTGDGDPPETIRPFMKLLRSKDKTCLEDLNFTVLALGDTNYENFCKTGKRVDTSLPKLGATRFFRRGDADDGTGLEIVVEPWIKALWAEFAKLAPPDLDFPKTATSVSQSLTENPRPSSPTAVVDSADSSTPTQTTIDTNSNAREPVQSIESVVRSVTAAELGFAESDLPPLFEPKLLVQSVDSTTTQSSTPLPVSLNPSYDPDTTVRATVTAARLLTAPDSPKTVWHAELCAPGAPAHRPGAAFGVIPENTQADVAAALSFVQHQPSDLVRLVDANVDAAGEHKPLIPVPVPVSKLLLQRPDLRAIPSKTLLRALALHCTDHDHARRLLLLSSRTGRGDYLVRITRPGKRLLDVLRDEAPSCRPPLALLLDMLPSVAPRWYSAASGGPVADEDSLHFAFSVVTDGLATPALAARCEAVTRGETSEEVLLLPRSSDSESNFHPPSLDSSYVMVGPGTGVAPFRGFLRERRELLQNKPSNSEDGDSVVGKAMLFFGCRNEAKDFLYGDELHQIRDEGVLDVLDVAFSRDGPTKVYVQDCMRKRAQEIGNILRDGGYLFVCGDGGGMASDVNSAITDIVAEQFCDGNTEEAKTMVKQMTNEGRYVRDIWFYGQLSEADDV